MTAAEVASGGAVADRTYAYRAFISYSHRDAAVAKRLHNALEAYRIPAKLVGKMTGVGPVPRRLRPIFRDREELPASADLGVELNAALRQAMFLIVVCSPAAAVSRWVNEEILEFKRVHGDGRVLALVVAGEPHGPGELECFPPALRFHLGPNGDLSDDPAEPIAADMRREADGRRLATQKIIAGLTGLKLDELVERETQRRIARITAVAMGAGAGMVMTGGLAFYANSLRIEASAQRKIAEREAAAAQAASDYLVGTFELSNPATDNPRTITAMTILSRSAERARTELSDQPEIQSRLLATLGRAYNNLGLLTEARAALESSLPSIEKSGASGAEAMLVLANTYAEQGQLEKGREAVRRAEALLGPDLKAHPKLRGMAALADGRILTSASDVKAGVAAFDRALAYYRAAPDVSKSAMAALLNNRGLLLSDDGQYDAAEASLRESLELLRSDLGEYHLSTGQAWFALGQNAFNRGDLPAAQNRIEYALQIERRVLDADNPILADTLSMKGQILQGLRRLPEAEAALREAIAIYRQAFDGPHYLIGIADVYLALIQSEQGKTAVALATLDDARRNYDASYGKTHPNHGDLLINRAKVLARAGRTQQARSDCAAGLAILRTTLGAEASFTRQMTQECDRLGGGVLTHSAPAASSLQSGGTTPEAPLAAGPPRAPLVRLDRRWPPAGTGLA